MSIAADVGNKRRTLFVLSVTQLLAMSVWFSASAVVPQLTSEWTLSGGEQAWLTMSVQIGFVAGALLMALMNVADRIPAQQLIAISAMSGALVNAGIPLFSTGVTSAIVLRFITGAAMAGVYPPGMKVMASWCKADRGLCIGLMVGALTIGSGMPQLLVGISSISSFSGTLGWRAVLYGTSIQAGLAAFFSWRWIQQGPFVDQARSFDWRNAMTGFTHRASRLANFGYFGHMWELYAVWAWAPLMLVASYEDAGRNTAAARFAAFGIFLMGGMSSLLAGKWSDRFGRTFVTSANLTLSGLCCVSVGYFYHSPALLTIVCLVWGFSVIGDSAQFSTAISELSDNRFVGTALQVQTSIGFLISMITVRLVPVLVQRFGWEYAFLILSLGPLLGVISMALLRGDKDATKMARGAR